MKTTQRKGALYLEMFSMHYCVLRLFMEDPSDQHSLSSRQSDCFQHNLVSRSISQKWIPSMKASNNSMGGGQTLPDTSVAARARLLIMDWSSFSGCAQFSGLLGKFTRECSGASAICSSRHENFTASYHLS